MRAWVRQGPIATPCRDARSSLGEPFFEFLAHSARVQGLVDYDTSTPVRLLEPPTGAKMELPGSMFDALG